MKANMLDTFVMPFNVRHAIWFCHFILEIELAKCQKNSVARKIHNENAIWRDMYVIL